MGGDEEKAAKGFVANFNAYLHMENSMLLAQNMDELERGKKTLKAMGQYDAVSGALKKMGGLGALLGKGAGIYNKEAAAINEILDKYDEMRRREGVGDFMDQVESTLDEFGNQIRDAAEEDIKPMYFFSQPEMLAEGARASKTKYAGLFLAQEGGNTRDPDALVDANGKIIANFRAARMNPEFETLVEQCGLKMETTEGANGRERKFFQATEFGARREIGIADAYVKIISAMPPQERKAVVDAGAFEAAKGAMAGNTAEKPANAHKGVM